MKRQKLWDLLKKEGITQSSLPLCPPDGDLKIVIAHTTAGAKKLVDFICSLDGVSNG